MKQTAPEIPGLENGLVGVVMTTELFSDEIERRINSGEDDSYIEAVARFIEELDQDASDMVQYLSPTLVGKIQAEALKRGMMKEKNRSASLLDML
jgi:hypothetical protein